MAYFDNRIIFLFTNGQVGFFDLKYYTWNFNIALRDVSFLMYSEWPNSNHQIEFYSDKSNIIEYKSSGDLSWKIEAVQTISLSSPIYVVGDFLYKVKFLQVDCNFILKNISNNLIFFYLHL